MRKLSLKELNRVGIEKFKSQKKIPIVLILDNIRSALNVGSAFRTADAFAVEKIYLLGISAQPPHREILKTAIGATESVDWEHFERTEELLERLEKENYQIATIEQAENSCMLNEFRPNINQKYALVFGNEVKGVDQKIMDSTGLCIEVPQYGTKHSLNVSVCIGVVVWDIKNKLLQLKEVQ